MRLTERASARCSQKLNRHCALPTRFKLSECELLTSALISSDERTLTSCTNHPSDDVAHLLCITTRDGDAQERVTNDRAVCCGVRDPVIRGGPHREHESFCSNI